MATITVTNNTLDFSFFSRKLFLTYTIGLDSGEIFNSIKVVSNRQWCNVKNKTVTAYETEIELSSNNSLQARSANLTITVTTNTGTYEYVAVLTQDKFVLHPIWSNTIARIETTLNSVQYHITHSGNTIYSGKAYVMPNTNYVEIDITKICASYLSSSLEGKLDNPANYSALNSVKSFNLYVNGNIEGAFVFYNNYTYKANPDYYTTIGGDTMLITSDPIRKEFDSRQYIVYSFFNALTSSSFGFRTYFNITGKYQQPEEVYASLVGRTGYVTTMKAPEGAESVEILNEEIPIKKTCCKYCLYYQNALGGWDSLLIYGNDKRTDKITGYNYIKAIDNNTKNFGTKKYLNTINSSYKLYTDWLTDDEASRMYHLLESTEVYLHNLEDDTIIPVNITNSNCEFKTFTNNGKKKFNYEINVELAQTRIRQ